MRRLSQRLAQAAVLSAAMAGLGFLPGRLQAADAAADTKTNAPVKSDPAAQQAQIPVKQVVLFSSGVGYFEHYGTVTGNGTTELRFKTGQINDVLKSLVLQDLDKGHVSTVTYPSQDPLGKTLKSFQIDLTNNPTLHQILEQLRGASVTAIVGSEKISGTVLGVEEKERPLGDKDDKKLAKVWYLNLLVGAGIRPVALDEVRDVQIDDAELREELTKALSAVAQARDQDKKPVTIRFEGKGDRRVRIGYVVEAPVWKTSYRLLIAGEPIAGDNDQQKDAPAQKSGDVGTFGVDKAPAAAKAHADAPPKPEGNLQGWAIIENQTESDWNNVQLSLVSGRPISFVQDLYQPLYIPRPVVQPELYASLKPQTYEGGIAMDRRAPQAFAGAPAPVAASVPMAELAGEAGQGPSFGHGQRSMAKAGAGNGQREEAALAPMDAAASVASAASAASLGDLFEYTVGSVSLPRQKSAMIPILTDPIEVHKVSIYNQSVLAKHPLYGARVKNTTDKHLPQGPVTVLQGGSYAGDARIDDMPPGQERLISYGIDLQIDVQAQNQKQESSILSGKIIKGILEVQYKQVASQDYVAENKSDQSKTLVIEHPRNGGDWKLTEPAKATETTDALYRFQDTLQPHKPKKLTVQEELVRSQTMAILPMDLGQVLMYAKTGAIPKEVRDALTKAAQLKGKMEDTRRQMQEKQQKVQQISAEQARIRDNMKTVDSKTDYYIRLLKKLGEQETQIETLQNEIQDLQKQADQQRKDLEDYISKLNVG